MVDEQSCELAVPVLLADGLVLRDVRAGDLEFALDASRDPFIPLITTVPVNASSEQAEAWIARQHERARSGTGYSFVIADADDDEAVGHIGLWLHKVGQGRASIGYWVLAPHRGRGVARAALAAVAAWGLDQLHLARLELYVEPWNTGSWKTAQAVGFQREGLMRSWELVGDQRRDMYMYSLLPDDPRGPAR